MTTQTETIVWHSGDAKPPEKVWGYFLATYKEYENSRKAVGQLRWNGYKWKWDDGENEFDVWEVIAWAELPKGWRDDK